MKNVFLATLIVLCGSTLAQAQSNKAAHKALVFSTAAQSADLLSTITIKDWEQREANTVVPTNNTGLILTKLGIATFNYFGNKKALQKHPKLVFWMQMGIGSGLSYVTIHNLKVR